MADTQALKVIAGVSLGPFSIGSSVHHVLNRIKADPATWPKIQVKYSPSEPLLYPVIVELPTHGLRLNFDATEQRLRFIEVLNFGLVRLEHDGKAINKLPGDDGYTSGGNASAGPEFKRVYNMFGPTTPGEYLEDEEGRGIYCISRQGIAFKFPLDAPEGFVKNDFANQIAILGSSACQAATSMVIFDGRSWALARSEIYTADMSHFLFTPVTSGKADSIPAEIVRARVHDRGRITLERRGTVPSTLRLGETTQQDLLTELGPPDSIYRKTNTTSIPRHKRRTSSTSSRRSNIHLDAHSDKNSGSDADSAEVWYDDDDDEEDLVVNGDAPAGEVETWWNYYSHGFDVLISQAYEPSPRSPTAPEDEHGSGLVLARNHLTVTKLCIHSNIPGSYQFNRHRRLRWSLDSWPLPDGMTSSHAQESPNLTSETKFPALATHLKAVFKESYESEAEEREQQQPLAINRGWEDSSLGNSMELLGGWEDGKNKKATSSVSDGDEGRIGEVLMYGFPGLAFEVLKNGAVSMVQVW